MRPLRIGLGIVFIILGILGLFLPILQGILFLVIGSMLIGKDTPPGRWLNRQIQKLTRKKRSESPKS